MKKVDFYNLPRAVQDHVVDSLAGRLVPVPILASYGPRPKAYYWWAFSGSCALALVLLHAIGFGNAASSLSLHPLPAALVYVLLVAGFALGLLNGGAYRARTRALPFVPGIYLFPANVIDAREAELRVFPMEQLGAARGDPAGAVVLDFKTEVFRLPLRDPARIKEALARVEESRARAASETDPRVRFELDALEPPSVMSPLAPQHQMTFVAPPWIRLSWVLGAATGVLLGGGLYQLRNNASDNSMLAHAQAKDDVESYRAYVERGKRHRESVAQVLLPRAELRVAVAKGTVAAIDEFIKAHPTTGIQAEVDAARRAAMQGEFERAKAEGTLASLLAFAELHPDHGLGDAYQQARRALFAQALARFKAAVPEGEEASVELVRRLLAYSEKRGAKSSGGVHRGPVVQVRFARQDSVSLGRADSAVSKNPSFNGVTSYPSRYLDEKRLAPHEQNLARALMDGLARVFESEVLTFELGPPASFKDDAPPEVDKPTLVVSYRIEWSGGAFAKKKPRGVFVGLFVFFRSVFLLPGEEPALPVKLTAAENVPKDIVDDSSLAKTPGAMESAAYDAMTRDAFGQFEQRYLGKWLKGSAKKQR